MYPKVKDDYQKFVEEFEVNLESGKTLHLKALAVSETLTHRGEREVFFELNGQLRTILVKDLSVEQDVTTNIKADKGHVGSVGAPMPGTVIEVNVKEGDKVTKGKPVIVISAMKMDAWWCRRHATALSRS